MKKKEHIYLALVNDDFELTDEVENYFSDEKISVMKHMKNIGILKIQTPRDLLDEELKFISHVELDEVIELADDGEE